VPCRGGLTRSSDDSDSYRDCNGSGAKGLAIVVELITNLKGDEFPNFTTLEEPCDGRLSSTVL
jgi:hypothetical protein